MTEKRTHFGINIHADGITVEAVPERIGYDLPALLETLKGMGPATFTEQAQALLQARLYGEKAA